MAKKSQADTRERSADGRSIPDEPQIEGQVPKAYPESDPIGINVNGGITTNAEGDPPGSDLEVHERENPPLTGPDRRDTWPAGEKK